jgi:Ca-activated chloride channel family protein
MNLVFLLDVSGSMDQEKKLPLVKSSMEMLLQGLDARDRISIVVYAGAAGMVLPPTSGALAPTIKDALENLKAGGSTNGAQGIELAYDTATKEFIKGGANRVILCTDGDFNVGVSDDESLKKLVVDRAKSGVFLTALGFGMGNHNDKMLETIADNGNGAYGYIDSEREVEKLFVKQLSGTLVTIAKDVKLQVEFNPQFVGSYRLIGYENRVLAAEDFNDDRKDAGEIGAGHTVTALYEVVPVGVELPLPGVDPLKYQKSTSLTDAAQSDELLTLKLRFKQPDGETSKLLSVPVKDGGRGFGQATADFQFAAAVAAFGMALRESPHQGNLTLDAVLEIARSAKGEDKPGYRQEFIGLVERAQQLKR